MSTYREACVHSPRRHGEPYAVTVTLNPHDGGGQAVRRVRVDDKSLGKATVQVIADTLLAARLLEPASADRWIASVRIQPSPEPGDRGWELALVLADRIARDAAGAFATPTEGRVFAYGHSDAWELGRLASLSAAEATLLNDRLREVMTPDDRALIGIGAGTAPAIEALEAQHPERLQTIGHLGAVLGRPDAADAVRRYRVAFPVVGGVHRLEWVEVSVRPCTAGEREWAAAEAGRDAATLLGIARPSLSRRVGEVLEQSRLWDGETRHRWHTAVRFSRDIDDNSWQLALVLADRIARGREIAPKGRLIATGMAAHGDTDWQTGAIGAVGQVAQKLDLLLAESLGKGDRVLVPHAARDELDRSTAVARLRERGVTVAAVGHLRIGASHDTAA